MAACNAQIQTIYRAHAQLHIATDGDAIIRFDERLGKLGDAKKYRCVDVSNSNGGPCWAAYFTAESPNKARLDEFMRSAEAIAKRLKITFE